MTYHGGCHCGRIAFDVEGDLKQVVECNCSICAKRAYLHWSVPREHFRLTSPEANIATYTFKSGRVKHQFCPVCGVAPLCITGPDKVNVNARCLDGVEAAALEVKHFDGRSL